VQPQHRQRFLRYNTLQTSDTPLNLQLISLKKLCITCTFYLRAPPEQATNADNCRAQSHTSATIFLLQIACVPALLQEATVVLLGVGASVLAVIGAVAILVWHIRRKPAAPPAAAAAVALPLGGAFGAAVAAAAAEEVAGEAAPAVAAVATAAVPVAPVAVAADQSVRRAALRLAVAAAVATVVAAVAPVLAAVAGLPQAVAAAVARPVTAAVTLWRGTLNAKDAYTTWVSANLYVTSLCCSVILCMLTNLTAYVACLQWPLVQHAIMAV
jgi:hypothetical protein